MSTRILALDTSTESCSVALLDNDNVLSRYDVCPREHTQRILPMVETVLAEAGISLNQLDALAYGQGPGSFTGIRISIGIAQGLALGADLPMIGISTLAAMAQGAYRQTKAKQVLSAIDARMGEIYWGEYQRSAEGIWMQVCSEQVLTPEGVSARLGDISGRWATVGTGWQTYPDLAANATIEIYDGRMLLPQAEDMLPLALREWQLGNIKPVEEAQPIYLRNEVTWKKLPGRE